MCLPRVNCRSLTEGEVMTLRRSCFHLFAAVSIFVTAFLWSGSVCRAEPSYTNTETGYRAVVEDDAFLLSGEEAQQLIVLLQEITAYGNVAFKTIDENFTDTESFARSYYQSQFGTDSGTLFLIDMDNRNIWIHSDGAVYKVITTAYANTITDNVYRYASNEDYFDCASEAFGQILSLLKGQKIAQPMKYISNGLLAAILALLLNFGFVSLFSRLKKPGKKEIMENIPRRFSYTKPTAVFTHKTRVYDPVSSGSGGGGSSGGSRSGGGGGGSRSGGGGGHRF